MYRLLIDPTLDAVWTSLPDDVRHQVDNAMAAVCQDPYGETEPWGIDDGITRQCTRPLVVIMVRVDDTQQTVKIYAIQPRRH